MWSLLLVTVLPFETVIPLGEIGRYTAFDQCVYMQHDIQPTVTLKDSDSFLLCVKDYKPTIGVDE